MPIDITVLGGRLTAARMRLGWTQAELADNSTISQGTISDLEAGNTARPRPDTIKALADALEVSVEWLFGIPDAPERIGKWNRPRGLAGDTKGGSR